MPRNSVITVSDAILYIQLSRTAQALERRTSPRSLHTESSSAVEVLDASGLVCSRGVWRHRRGYWGYCNEHYQAMYHKILAADLS